MSAVISPEASGAPPAIPRNCRYVTDRTKDPMTRMGHKTRPSLRGFHPLRAGELTPGRGGGSRAGADFGGGGAVEHEATVGCRVDEDRVAVAEVALQQAQRDRV